MTRGLLLTGAVLAAAGWWAHHATQRDLGTVRDLHGAGYVQSTGCRRCHEDHWQSWHRTFHRTMTREATEDTVLGAFDGSQLGYFGWTARMTREDGRFMLSVDGPKGAHERIEIVRTVGSHRYQQYLAKDDDTYWRLPVAWHLEEQRWIHMNGAFLTPDPAAPAEREDFARHVTRWNDNCVFCHNVAPNPGVHGERFDTSTAELGIACEACHGPGEEHAARNANPLRRYTLHLGEASDPTIINPARLSPERSADICGRCHGQRKTDRLERFMAEGDPFVPGDDLAHSSEPLWVDTTLDGEEVFAARFWPDGTARLTAYEFQGWLQSPCTQQGEMTCTDCHGMHEGDPAGQMRPSAAEDGGCGSCHGDMEEDHGRHSGVASCVDCHMPRIVYGLVGAHRSHRIESPRPGDARRPDACTLCHVDRSRGWAEETLAWVAGRSDIPVSMHEERAEAERLLLAGDPIERSVAADAFGRTTLGDDMVVRGLLLDVMQHDPYPAVRRIAFRSLRRRTDPPPPWPRFRPAEPATRRRGRVEALRRDLPHRAPNANEVAQLRALATSRAIEIGE